MSLQIIRADYHNPEHADAIVSMLRHYAEDPMGGGSPLPGAVCDALVPELARRDFALSILAFLDDRPAGLINAFEGFSTFACRPLINIHDVFVERSQRGKGIAQAMFAEIDKLAIERRCCKLTLEVLAHNQAAKAVYRKLGFTPYQLCPETGSAEFWQRPL